VACGAHVSLLGSAPASVSLLRAVLPTSAGVGQVGCLVAAAEEAGAGARARLGQREGDGDALDRLPVRVEHTCPQRPTVAGADGCFLPRTVDRGERVGGGVVCEAEGGRGREVGGGGGGGEAAGAGGRDQGRRGRLPIRLGGRGRLRAAAEEAGTGAGRAGGDREGHGRPLDGLAVRVDDLGLQRLRVLAVDGRLLAGGASGRDRCRRAVGGVGQVELDGAVVGVGVDAVAAGGVVGGEGGRGRGTARVGADGGVIRTAGGEDAPRAGSGGGGHAVA